MEELPSRAEKMGAFTAQLRLCPFKALLEAGFTWNVLRQRRSRSVAIVRGLLGHRNGIDQQEAEC